MRNKEKAGLECRIPCENIIASAKPQDRGHCDAGWAVLQSLFPVSAAGTNGSSFSFLNVQMHLALKPNGFA